MGKIQLQNQEICLYSGVKILYVYHIHTSRLTITSEVLACLIRSFRKSAYIQLH